MQAALLEKRLDIRNRKHNFKTYPNCFVGSEAVKYILELDLAQNVDGAIDFGKQLIESNYIRHVENQHTFKNSYYFYQFTLKFHQTMLNDMEEQEQVRILYTR